MADYIPIRDGDIVTWLKNFSSKLATYAKALGMNDTQLKTEQKGITALRALARWIKASPTYTEAMGQDIMLVGTSTNALLDDIQPGIKVEAYKGFVRLGFKKGKLECVLKLVPWRAKQESLPKV